MTDFAVVQLLAGTPEAAVQTGSGQTQTRRYKRVSLEFFFVKIVSGDQRAGDEAIKTLFFLPRECEDGDLHRLLLLFSWHREAFERAASRVRVEGYVYTP